MGVIINCTESHLDYFTRNLTVCKGDQVATTHGYVSAARVEDAEDEPLEVSEVAEYLNETRAEQNAQIAIWLKAARQKVEKDTGVIMTASPQTWRVTVEQFPSFRQSLFVPVWPVLSIETFTYVDRDGAEQDLITSPTNFILASDGRPTQIGLIDSANWPTRARKFHPGTLTVTAGWATVEAIPADLLMAIKKAVADFAGFRESAVGGLVGSALETAPQNYEDLIARWVLPGIA